MNYRIALIAVGFATLAAVFVTIGFRGQERRDEVQAEMAAGLLDAQEPAGLSSIEPLSRQDRRGLALGAGLLALGAYVWILVMAFREDLVWGLFVLFTNGIGAVFFTVFHPRQSFLPLFLMFGGFGTSWVIRFGVGA